MEIICDNCGNIKRRTPAQVKRSKYHFCSKQCYHEFMRKNSIHALSKEVVEELYNEKELSQSEISELCGVSIGHLNWLFHIYKIKGRSLSDAQKLFLRKNTDEKERRAEHLQSLPAWNAGLAGKGICLGYREGSNWSETQRKKFVDSMLKYKEVLTKVYLYTEHVLKERSITQIAEDVGCESSTVKNYIAIHDVPYTSHQREICDRNLKLRFTDPEVRDKCAKNRQRGLHLKPNKQEKEIVTIIEELKLPYKYTGDGSVVIDGLVPDFTNCNGEKKVIEFFGDYWHGGTDRYTPKYASQTEEGRLERYKNFGFHCLIVWGHELADRETLINKMLDFEKGGVK